MPSPRWRPVTHPHLSPGERVLLVLHGGLLHALHVPLPPPTLAPTHPSTLASTLHTGERVLLVLHGGLLHALHVHATGRFCGTLLRNASIGILKVDGPVWLVVQWHDTSHLAQAEADAHGFGGGKAG